MILTNGAPKRQRPRSRKLKLGLAAVGCGEHAPAQAASSIIGVGLMGIRMSSK